MIDRRKPKRADIKWPCLVQTRISEQAFDSLNAKADAEGLSLASYLRRLIMRDAKSEADDPSLSR